MPSFIAKWSQKYPGCSGHIHQSLSDGKTNLFFDGNAPQAAWTMSEAESAEFTHLVGGLPAAADMDLDDDPHYAGFVVELQAIRVKRVNASGDFCAEGTGDFDGVVGHAHRVTACVRVLRFEREHERVDTLEEQLFDAPRLRFDAHFEALLIAAVFDDEAAFVERL